MVRRFVIGGVFFFSFSFLSSLKNYSLALAIVGISTSILIFFISNLFP